MSSIGRCQPHIRSLYGPVANPEPVGVGTGSITRLAPIGCSFVTLRLLSVGREWSLKRVISSAYSKLLTKEVSSRRRPSTFLWSIPGLLSV
jgi:hypothetical protein